LFSVRDNGSAAIIDTHLQMKAFEKAVETEKIPWLRGCVVKKRNTRLGASLIDYLLECGGEKVYLEVKSAVLRKAGYAMYPDCPSPRGRKHIRELINHAKEDGQAAILFIAALPGVKGFKPNKDADPEVNRLLKKACEEGVTLRCIGLHYDPNDRFIHLYNPDIKVSLA